MAIIRGDGKGAAKRRPALRGLVMQDVSRGAERTRAWPRSRGKPKAPGEAERQKKFAMANLATKYVAPQIAVDFTNAVKGTPLLPRDLLISMFYQRLAAIVMPDGKVLWPMPARNDVSQALDALANQPGQMLRRGPAIWEPVEEIASTAKGCVLTRATAFTVAPANADTPVTWTGQVVDQNDFFDPTDSTKITCREEGWYAGYMRAVYTGGTGSYRKASVEISGVTTFWQDTTLGTTGGNYPLNVPFLAYLTAGAQIRLLVQNNATNRVWFDCLAVLFMVG